NSFHIPGYYPIQAINKIRLEGPFHALCNGGHITYIELDGAAAHNQMALKQIVQAMAQYEVGYGSSNHPVARCKCCDYNGVIENECPSCGNIEDQHIE
ncbi:anaerobic ribonucleoside-triphosphate reductase, partial [Bacillus cereus]|uniref:anaerobic ribonucleoside-triphosphate reductase n=1 Tax=Bacillus cereus TaxID=1396 RepID=UPI00284889D6